MRFRNFKANLPNWGFAFFVGDALWPWVLALPLMAYQVDLWVQFAVCTGLIYGRLKKPFVLTNARWMGVVGCL